MKSFKIIMATLLMIGSLFSVSQTTFAQTTEEDISEQLDETAIEYERNIAYKWWMVMT